MSKILIKCYRCTSCETSYIPLYLTSYLLKVAGKVYMTLI
nr:MAG TPA: hypothetical protein [Caudoviricetes sp.]DAR91977.1 MAG TPA: hypothetical protein [Bacteriophage sp.]